MVVTEDLSEKINFELRRIEEDCIFSAKSHFNASARLEKWNYFLGIPSVILSATAAAAFLKNYQDAAVILSSLASIITALMTFLKPSELSSAHNHSGNQYLALRNDARVFREIKLLAITEDTTAISEVNALTKRRDELNQAAIQCSTRDFNKARKGIEAGEAYYEIDKGNG